MKKRLRTKKIPPVNSSRSSVIDMNSKTRFYAPRTILRHPFASFSGNSIFTTDILPFNSHVELLNFVTLLDLDIYKRVLFLDG